MIGVDNFWGRTDISVGNYADFSKLPAYGEMDRLLSYVSEYSVEDYGDNYKKFYFNVSTYEPEKKEGYIIFVKFGQNIETNGKKIFGRYPTEIVVVLKEGEYLEFNGKKVEVINEQLVLYI